MAGSPDDKDGRPGGWQADRLGGRTDSWAATSCSPLGGSHHRSPVSGLALIPTLSGRRIRLRPAPKARTCYRYLGQMGTGEKERKSLLKAGTPQTGSPNRLRAHERPEACG